MSKFNSITNKELLEIAKKKGIYISSSIRNTLLSFRGIENDVKGDDARQSVIISIQSHEKTRWSFGISIFSILIAIISLIITFAK